MEGEKRSVNVQEIVARVEGLVREKRYDDVRVMGKDLLPLILEEDHAVRLHVYHLLQRCPGIDLPEVHRWNARAVAEDVMADRKSTLEERIHAHMLHVLLGPFTMSVPEGAHVDPNRRWLSQELREFHAEEAVVGILGRGGEGNRDLQRDAHIVRCFTCPDHRSVEAHFEALLADGDETAIVQGCCGASQEFHAATACQFLHRALEAVTKEKAIARLLACKLSVLLQLCMQGPRERTKESEDQYKALYRDFIATMTRLELCGGALLERAYAHLYYATLADWCGDIALAGVHCDMAQSLVGHLQNPGFQQAVDECRSWIFSEEEDGVEGGNEEGEEDQEEDEGTRYYEDDDDDDDDEADDWKKA